MQAQIITKKIKIKMREFAEIRNDWNYTQSVNDSFVIPEIRLTPDSKELGVKSFKECSLTKFSTEKTSLCR